MSWVTVYIVCQLAIVIVAIFLGYFIFDKRYKRNNEDTIPDGFVRTDEVSIDPISDEKRRVYYHPRTGERIYKLEVRK